MKRTYNILASGALADRAKGEIEFLIHVSDIDAGKRILNVFVPIDTPDIDTAGRILTSQVTISFAAAGLVAEDGEISALVEKMSNLILKEHPRFVHDPLQSALMKIGGQIIVQTTVLPQNGKLRVLYFIGTEKDNPPFAGVDIYQMDAQSVDNAKTVLRAQMSSVAVMQKLTEEEERSISDYLVSTLVSRCA